MQTKCSVILVFLCFLVSLPCSLLGQRISYGFHLTGSKKPIGIPFKLVSNLIIIPVQINDQDTLQFVLDSGVGFTLLIDPSKKDVCTDVFGRGMVIDGLGREKASNANISLGNKLVIGNVQVFNHSVVVFEDNLLELSEVIGTSVHGLIGYELLERFVITVDFKARKLFFQQPEKYVYKKSKGKKVPIAIINNKSYVDSVRVKEKDKVRYLRLMIDTGAGHALILNPESTHIPIPDKTIHIPLGVGLAGEVNGFLGRLDEVSFNGIQFFDVLSSFPDSLSYGSKISLRGSPYGNIGGELLRRFKVTFNYPERYVIFQPVRSLLKEPFEHNMSGMDLRAAGPDYQTIFINTVAENSPAFKAGLRTGDEVLFVNNVSVKTSGLNELYKVLQRRKGKEITVIVRRKKELISSRFILKSVI
jgi:hypothetical protein